MAKFTSEKPRLVKDMFRLKPVGNPLLEGLVVL